MVIFYGQQILQRQKNMKDFRDDRQFGIIHMKTCMLDYCEIFKKAYF